MEMTEGPWRGRTFWGSYTLPTVQRGVVDITARISRRIVLRATLHGEKYVGKEV